MNEALLERESEEQKGIIIYHHHWEKLLLKFSFLFYSKKENRQEK